MNDLILLAALLRGPAYGYALKRNAALIFGNTDMHNNVVYPSLKRFEQNGWVKQSTIDGERGQERKQYQLSAAGKKYLFEQVAAFGESEAGDDEAFLFRVALFDALPKRVRAAIIAARKSFLMSRAERLSELREREKPRSFGAVALNRVQALLQDELSWLQQLPTDKPVKEMGDAKR